MRKTLCRAALLCIAIATIGAPLLQAQEPEPEAFTLGFPLRFNFAPPGARATGLGATFIGLADDATAAAANPAGLTILVEPEVSAHIRFTTVDLQQPGIFTDVQTSSEGTTSPAYFSFVYPWSRASISVYYQQESNFNAEFNEQGSLGPFPDPFLRRSFPSPITLTYHESDQVVLDQIGFAGAVKLSSALSVGGGVRFVRADVDATIAVRQDQPEVNQIWGNFYSDTFFVSQTDRNVTFNIGVLAKPNDKFSAGFVYRQGGEFDFEPGGTEVFLGTTTSYTFPAKRFAVPDSYGFGIAARPTEKFTVAFDVARVEYTDINPDEPALNDATEVHAGAEYVFLVGTGATPLSLRGGFFTDPDHDEFEDIDSGQTHVTFGAGVVLAQRFQIDWALNLAENITDTIFSLVLRF